MERENTPFAEHAADYDKWFDRHPAVFASELKALKTLLPATGLGLEVGIGTGRFAAPLGINLGIEPIEAMAQIARKKGITVISGKAEALPVQKQTFDRILFMTSVCFLESPAKAFREARRVLKPGGVVVVGFINRESALGEKYERRKKESLFYRDARFYSGHEIMDLLDYAGFVDFQQGETIFRPLAEISVPEPVRKGIAIGGFGVIRATDSKKN